MKSHVFRTAELDKASAVFLLFQCVHFLFDAKEEFRWAYGKGITDEEDGIDSRAVRFLFDIQQIETLKGGKVCESGLGKAALKAELFDGFGKCVR